ncbi:hypothetical protein NC651_037533 [Populus alba x Populus x berolinensis]|nr:hypothetical protein NC651_037533 [Populus alba x Populus x berolinensis]
MVTLETLHRSLAFHKAHPLSLSLSWLVGLLRLALLLMAA